MFFILLHLNFLRIYKILTNVWKILIIIFYCFLDKNKLFKTLIQ